ncbi:Stk1 family PASTA domain-containing Ser/Thr kinase [Alicyclobacillus cycloheptanicus]|uniref:non-specific serine/threonine protein kinase n=1 Tax=Alicyclobacillus cycloheptanicus TaxID=1457 RepID=A0ABT9XKL2_9BACL|nr:Stk1 family PASTA domain-containing Ser/Thr kinase [Alicyclobacillus cycloheptanicus]MDQ0190842.1 serine/threonine-protein kinase [Alicyclobacillus cycloheptanicus]WDM01459.1 Stk1 family PASTA domain-containing Ser/Thr kinase [Alicyclobacillus cycloheptanicus]
MTIKRLGGRYELETVIGGGGMAVVYKALDTLLNRTVAVKMLRAQYAGDEEFVNRFRQEAQSAARLSHPNIVSLYDVGMSEGEYYIVMEYVNGPTLKDVIRERAPLPVPEALDITQQICDALAHAHDHRIIHRDVKPHNILLTQSGQVKVTDFGIARAVTGNTITLQHDTSVLGSVHYFSPEQARGGAASVKSDIYSVGVVLYEMLTKQLPFSGDSPVSVALKHLRDRFVDPRDINPDIPQSVENIILRCLVKRPEARYPDMRAVKADLQTALDNPDVPKFVTPADTTTEETIAIPAIGGTRAAISSSSDGQAADPQPKKRRKWWKSLMWTGVGLAVLCVGALAAYYIVMDLVQVPNVTMPNVIGKTEQQAITILVKDGFSRGQIHTQQAASAQQPQGHVYAQTPPASEQVKPTRDVYLYISTGQAKIQVPDVTGLPAGQAYTTLQNDGFTNIKDVQVQSAEVPAGDVVASNPPANSKVTPNTPITLQVSQGAETSVPDVIGMTLSEATNALKQAHLQLGQVNQIAYPAAPDGSVFNTFPYKPGDQVPAGTTIDLWVATNSGTANNTTGNETGSGGGNAANATNTTNTSLDNLPPDTHVRPVTIRVPDKNGKPIQVLIDKSDAVSSNEAAVNQTITKDSTWTITLYLTPDSQGEIQVYENGKLKQDYPVQY